MVVRLSTIVLTLSLSVADAQTPFLQTYSFDTDGPTICGVNENLESTIVGELPGNDGEFIGYPLERSAQLACNDSNDDVLGTVGFGDEYTEQRRITYGIECACILSYYFLPIENSLIVWRDSEGPTELIVFQVLENDTLFVNVTEEPSLVTISTSTIFDVFITFALEARGGTPEGALYIDNIVLDGNVIPVELLSFDAIVAGTEVMLRWATSSETNNSGFEVQMLPDGRSEYQLLGFVEGHGTTTEVQHYTYSVAGLNSGTHMFRLKQIDFDGGFEYSQEIEVSVGVPGTHVLEAAYPNPFNPEATFRFGVNAQQNVRAELVDVLGRVVNTLFEGNVAADEMQTVRIDGSGLPSGTYMIRIVGETFADAQSVTLLK